MVIVLLANGFEELEALTPVDVLRRNNIDVRTVSITSDKLITGTHGIQIATDLLASEVPLDQIDMLILPGGMPGVKNLDASPVTQTFIDATLRNNGRLAAICAAPSIFGKHGMLTNIKATCFPGFEGEMHNAILIDSDVVTDGIFTTARDYRAATAFADELVRICDIISIKPKDESVVLEEPVKEIIDFDFSLFEKVIKDTPIKADGESEKIAVKKEKHDFSGYKIPPLDLLGLDEQTEDDDSEVAENAKTIIETLKTFGAHASIRNVDRGPRITRYELVPENGVKVSSITRLLDDIALNLAKEGVRMQAPIPGKSAIGLEVPNTISKNVRLRELLEHDEFKNSVSKTYVAIGKDVTGEPIYGDISRFPHALISGATGMGKSVCINSILASLLYRMRPDELKLIMIDPKKVEFNMYCGIPHLLVPVITEAKKAAGALMWAVKEMENRYTLIEQAGVRNIEAYNAKVAENPTLGDPVPKIVIVIDELADLMMQVRDPVEDLIMRIAQKARAAGIHVIVGTQRPSVQVITGCIKANIPTRISCKVTSQVDSRTIFDMSGAEKLLNRGDMLYWPIDKTMPLRVQCAFVSDGEIEGITSFIKEQYPNYDYDPDIIETINNEAEKLRIKNAIFNEDEEDCGLLNDQQFLDAVEISIRSGKVSTSLIQRKMSIGYGKAAKYIDAMEELGIISEFNGQKPREVLMSLDEWHEKLAKITI